MIPTISQLLYRVHHEKQYWLTQAERRRALLLVCLIIFLLIGSVFLWL